MPRIEGAFSAIASYDCKMNYSNDCVDGLVVIAVTFLENIVGATIILEVTNTFPALLFV